MSSKHMSDEARAAAITERLATLVAFDTQNPPGNEAACAEFVGRCMADIGCKVRLEEVETGRPNVIGVFENGPGPTLAFNTHMDVVPFGEGWASDPCKLTLAGDKLVARGACDAKGPLAAMIEAMAILISQADHWRGTLCGIFVVDEEVESRGAKALADTGISIDYCIVGEPTSCRVVNAHKGSMRPLIRVNGVTAHSASPHLGRNAILLAAPLLRLIDEENARLQTRHHPLLGHPTLSVTRAWGGHASNAVPEHCDFLLDRRLIPGEDEGAVEEELRILARWAGEKANTAVEILRFNPTTGGPMETARDDPLVVAALKAACHHAGETFDVAGFQGGCDLVHFRKLGAAGIVLGPGSIDVAHKPDEFVPREELLRSALIYRDIVLDMLSPSRQRRARR